MASAASTVWSLSPASPDSAHRSDAELSRTQANATPKIAALNRSFACLLSLKPRPLTP